MSDRRGEKPTTLVWCGYLDDMDMMCTLVPRVEALGNPKGCPSNPKGCPSNPKGCR